MAIAVLALQGAFEEHIHMFQHLGSDAFEVRQRKDLERPFEGLVLPGGESTVMKKLLYDLELYAPLKEKIEAGLPVLGTCAGLILLAKAVEGGEPCFATMNMVAKRNAYGRQLGSFHTETMCKGVGNIPMTFIRAPYIVQAGEGVEVLAEVDGKIVAAQEGSQLATAFHPELTKTTALHQYFLEMTQKNMIWLGK